MVAEKLLLYLCHKEVLGHLLLYVMKFNTLTIFNLSSKFLVGMLLNPKRLDNFFFCIKPCRVKTQNNLVILSNCKLHTTIHIQPPILNAAHHTALFPAKCNANFNKSLFVIQICTISFGFYLA